MVAVTDSLVHILDDPTVQAVAIATPTATHFELASAALRAGKHVLVEKPLASSVAEGEQLVELADRSGLVLMCDHTYCYTPAVGYLRDMLACGSLGELQYVDSVRINLGLVQRDIDVFWDLAPHDLSVLDYVLPQDSRPAAVAAHGADPVGAGNSCVGYLTLPLTNGSIAHLHVNWLSPTKVRRVILGGSKRMVVWDDLNPAQRLAVYDRGVDVAASAFTDVFHKSQISYRLGDMTAPALPEREALQDVVCELVNAIRERRLARTDGASGLRILRVLEAASTSLRKGGLLVRLGAPLGIAVATAV
jgi:predicted dehydrogenase